MTNPGLPQSAQSQTVSYAIFRLARSHRMLAGQLLRDLGLRPGQELLMMHLWEDGPSRQSVLAALFDTDSASMTRTVQRLERSGYVRRVPDPADGRATLVEPTPAGLALRARVEEVWRELERLTLGHIEPPEAARLHAAISGLERNVVAALKATSIGH
jgi:DNA-binding MarR family transcriptional regulator